jgi:hypothetical protein
VNFLDLVDQIAPTWHAKAACHPGNGHDPELWFPKTPNDRPGSARSRQGATAAAIAICNTCPVKQKCLDDAIAIRVSWGIWGGVDFEHKRATDAA